MISLCQKGKKIGGGGGVGVTEFVLEIKRITGHSIFRRFGNLVQFWIHCYQQKFK